MPLFLATLSKLIRYLFIFFLLRATSAAYGNFLARVPTGAAAAGLHHSYGNIRSQLHL